ncbi:HAD domain-containing protein [Thermomonospora amylolytica]|uniref:HAD domain-containing protein n=1 Tax=Thermomonospora amylolytica TaxID=1411117 RepID=UPI000E6D49C8|nr:HAD domain-containing protein [Thermomonospora amylolytica]
MAKPLVLLDVDGVLNPFGGPPGGFREVRVAPDGVHLTLWLNRAHGPRLVELAESTGSELAWASYWCDRANEWVAPRIGLPELPYVPIPPYPGHPDGVSLGAWKVRHVAEWVGDRPFVWFEDEPDAAERLLDHLAEGTHLLVSVDPDEGLTDFHLERARAWLSALGRDPR